MITVTITGLDLSPIVWRSEGLWISPFQYTHHTIPGAVKGKTYPQGKDNATATLQGRCPRTATNEVLLNSMVGQIAEIVGRNTHTARVMSITDNKQDNPAWIYFTMSVMEE